MKTKQKPPSFQHAKQSWTTLTDQGDQGLEGLTITFGVGGESFVLPNSNQTFFLFLFERDSPQDRSHCATRQS
jgi:hypothetical protein